MEVRTDMILNTFGLMTAGHSMMCSLKLLSERVTLKAKSTLPMV